MPSKHKRNPIPFRPPEGDRARLLALAERTGQPVNRILAAALASHLDATEPVIGYLVDGKVWHPSDVAIIRPDSTAFPEQRQS